MKPVSLNFLIACLCLAGFGHQAYTQGQDAPRKTLLVHYMPWYASKPVSRQWGWHWTMNHFNPDKVNADGQRELAAHDPPLIGPYDSSDPDALECHVLLMKLAGIDGVIIDWYGIKDFRDYARIHRNSRQLVSHIRKAGLRFAVCYEDRSISNMVNDGVLKKSREISQAGKIMQWLEKNWFDDHTYLQINERPVLLVFGPLHFKKPDWTRITSDLSSRPMLHALPHLSGPSGFDGAFGWPPVHGGKEIIPTVWRQYLHDLYARGKSGESIIATAFPGFHDIYKEALLHDSYGYLDAQDGRTLRETLDLAWKSNSSLVQIATWNDFGEGTMVEPTTNLGYQYLETIQAHMKKHHRKAFLFKREDLRLPIRLYQLRKQGSGDKKTKAHLDRVSSLLFSSKCDEAGTLLIKGEI